MLCVRSALCCDSGDRVPGRLLSERTIPCGNRVPYELIRSAVCVMSRFLIVDDHPLYRFGFMAALQARMPHLELQGCSDAAAAMADLDLHPNTDLVVIDFRMPGMDGISALAEFGRRHPQVPRMLISGDADPNLARRALAAGASGFVPKSLPIDELEFAIRSVLEGATYSPPSIEQEHRPGDALTLRQLEVLNRLARGQTNREIADALHITERTAKAHVAAIFVALDVDNRTQAVLAAQRAELVGPSH